MQTASDAALGIVHQPTQPQGDQWQLLPQQAPPSEIQPDVDSKTVESKTQLSTNVPLSNRRTNSPLKSFVPLFFAIGSHLVFVLLHSQHLPSMTYLHQVHAGCLVIGLYFRLKGNLHIAGCMLIVSGTTFICAQSGLCMLAMQYGLEAVSWVLLSLLISLFVMILVHVYVHFFQKGKHLQLVV